MSKTWQQCEVCNDWFDWEDSRTFVMKCSSCGVIIGLCVNCKTYYLECSLCKHINWAKERL